MQTYQEFVELELSRRKAKNPAYSLRSFAKALGITASHLSAVLKGKKDLSKATAIKFAECMKLNQNETELFLWMVKANTSKSILDQKKAQEKIEELKSETAFKLMSENEMNVLSSWPYATLIELFELSNFQSDTDWIAQKMQATPAEIQTYLTNLENLSILDRSGEKWKIVKKNISSPTVSSTAIRSYLASGLDHAKHSLMTQDTSQRDMSSIVMAIDNTRLEEAKAAIKEFRRNFFKEFSAGQDKQSVFCLSVQFFSTLEVNTDQ